MAISDKLQELLDVKQDIKEAIENKDVDMTDVAFTEYANKILDISGGGGEVDEYFYYSKSYYTITNNSTLFSNAWESSLAVDPLEISANGTFSNSGRGTAQYPNGEIEGVIIPEGITTIGNYAFSGWKANDQPLVIPDSVTSIGIGAFSGWQANDQPLVIPDSVTSIRDELFAGWKSNTHQLVIPNSVTSIGAYAFDSWTSNNQPLVIPDSVTEIEYGAFRNWLKVPYVEIQAITPPMSVGSWAFTNQNDAPIYVPDESVDDYKTAENWEDVADRIFPISDKPDDKVEPTVVELTQEKYYALSVYDDNTYYLIVEEE